MVGDFVLENQELLSRYYLKPGAVEDSEENTCVKEVWVAQEPAGNSDPDFWIAVRI